MPTLNWIGKEKVVGKERIRYGADTQDCRYRGCEESLEGGNYEDRRSLTTNTV